MSEELVPKLTELDMMLPTEVYEEQEIGKGSCLITIPDFNTLVAKSQEAHTPVFALTREQIGQAGTVLEITMKSRDKFKEIFSKLADRVIGLTSYASSD